MIGLTPKQGALLRFIRGYQLAHDGVSPSVRECARGLGLASSSGIQMMLKGLEEGGSIRRLRQRQRAIELLKPLPIPSIDGAPLYVVPLVGVRSVRFSGERL